MKTISVFLLKIIIFTSVIYCSISHGRFYRNAKNSKSKKKKSENNRKQQLFLLKISILEGKENNKYDVKETGVKLDGKCHMENPYGFFFRKSFFS